MENGAMGSFFGRLEVEMIYGEMFETVNGFVHRLREYIDYRKND
ncbi:MAG TPA: integrase core domain-containing protein [Candidatus Borkfalkia faecipullorum]|uniref:Integrase core domain-containing protein n=1 Tax=Candidatus Borkfalkia faecipullorum TaxID=2838510 RepID=A0A9D1V8F1_9FIRM|nr:integrase core domain-containing protein [Candidatus Borkfalkia faecipullorum]